MSESVQLLIVFSCLLRKRASPLPKDEHSGGVKDSLLGNSSDPVEMRRLNYQTPGRSEQSQVSTVQVSLISHL